VAVVGEPGLAGLLVEWEGKKYPLSWIAAASSWRAVLPISIDCPRQQTLRVHQDDQTLLERTVSVKARNYGTQYLSISPATLASYDDPQNKADDQAILASMKKLDEQQRWQGHFQLPCEAPESTGFGQRRLYNGWKKGWHKGLDLAGWEGQAVLAPAAGRVIHRARGIVNGNTLALSHGLGVFSVYFHLNDFAVGLGDSVEAGQSIATVGGTGGFAPHLHWEMRAYGAPVHPKAFLTLPADWR
jgi:murein DD-endopeptidase MepM/ murein hydrolase activator NlpD